jgi:hypothetical protein
MGFFNFNKEPERPQYDMAAWEWRGPDSFAPDSLTTNINFAAAENIRTIYINIGKITDINEIADPAAKAKALADFNAAMRTYIQEAHRSGIEVHGLAGSVQWSEPDYRYLPLQLMDYVGAYNTSVSLEERLDGMQFDIESYNDRRFDRSRETKVANLTNYLTTADELHDRLVELQKTQPDLKLGFAIPYWFDNQNNKVPDLDYEGNIKPVGYHLMDILNRSEGGYIALMDYTNRAGGSNGSIKRAENEMKYLQEKARNVHMVIGQLMGTAKPKSSTFSGQKPDYIYKQLGLLNSAYESNPNYDGIAVHDLKTFKKLVED